jgi:hypothetical protein
MLKTIKQAQLLSFTEDKAILQTEHAESVKQASASLQSTGFNFL